MAQSDCESILATISELADRYWNGSKSLLKSERFKGNLLLLSKLVTTTTIRCLVLILIVVMLLYYKSRYLARTPPVKQLEKYDKL